MARLPHERSGSRLLHVLVLAGLLLGTIAGVRAEEPKKVRYKGKLVTLEEKKKLEQGYVQHEGQWVTKEELKLLKKGKVRYRGRWVSKEDRAQMEKGLLPHRKQWIPRAEADRFHAKWDNAWELEGLWFFVRTNAGEAVGSEVLAALETALPEYRSFYLDKEPKRSKKNVHKIDDVRVRGGLMPVFILKDKDEYADYCNDHGGEQMINSTGFFDSRDSVYVTYEFGLGMPTLISRTLGGVSELYTWYAWKDRVPDWMAEGAKRYFEKSEWDGEKETLRLGLPYTSLLELIPNGRPMPMKKLLRTGYADLKNRDQRWSWSGQCWAFVHMMRSERGAPFRDSWEDLCEKYIKVPSFTDMQEGANNHGARIFDKIFKKEMSALETAFAEHVTAQMSSSG